LPTCSASSGRPAERYLVSRTRLAHLPYQRTLEDLDFTFRPSIDERQVRDLAGLSFVPEAANVLLRGPPGVDKTHLAIAFGLCCIEHGYGVYPVRAHELLIDLRRAQAEPRWTAACACTWLRRSSSSTSLASGPMTGWPPRRSSPSFPPGTNEAASSLTSNKDIADWGEVLGDPVIATVLDGLLYQSHVFNIRGESYRLREKQRAGLFSAPLIPIEGGHTASRSLIPRVGQF